MKMTAPPGRLGKQLFGEDQPWEGANRNTYPTVAYDPLVVPLLPLFF